ncbi:recombinase family protein [Flavobacterium psychrophilum]|uniref:recombinase family protein n=1 Tax=Flavobacterium psychrophilum TaxID=96345 RepID=UPI000B7C0DF0|nr:recombinase family protein [Flavobacterium psychrophilum]MBF2023546.1 recombinase family protein [Flavobacterium psychrophilum]MCB5984125.1 recombinase family protein [Flavobacterium psychrophilum]MCB5994131.1 recombinase family protein [Flavobacterium psychrophilum]MCB5997063.1 recombinase family protein [Flavobacterium psychrophilum]MCB6004409.1 recombinase family protein [Flavobacterium psychrophilum]
MTHIKQNRKRTAVIYTRVSTDEQKENGFSLQDQHSKLLTDCERNNIEVLKHYQDDHSAKDFNRPEFKNFLKDVESKKLKPDLFICVRPDRFSRNLQNTMGMLTKFKSLGIEFKTLENHTDLDSPESLLPFLIYNLMPQIDNERRGLNTKQGMRQAQREGRTMGRPPLGYLNEKFTKTIVFDPNNAPLIKLGFEELSKGIYTIEEVRKKLIKHGLKNCCKQSFLNHVRNPYYFGLIKVLAWKNEPEEEIIGQHPPLISKELFEEVQTVLFGKRRKLPVALTRKDELPLRGYLTCNKCGGNLTGSPSTSGNGCSKTFYYHCQKGCKERFRADLANDCFENYLDSFKVDPAVLNLYKIILEDVFNQDEQERFKNIKQVEDMIALVKIKLNSLEDKMLDNVVSSEDYHSIKTRINGELSDWKFKKEDLSIDKSAYQKYFEFGLSFLSNAKEYYQKADLEIKQKIVGSIFPEKIIFSNNKYRTSQTNELLKLLTFNINELGNIKNEKATPKSGLSNYAPSLGLEPRTL